MGSVIKQSSEKNAETNPKKQEKTTGKKRAVGANKYLPNRRLSKKQGKMNLESDAVYSDKLAIFSTDVSVLKREWVNSQPTTEWGKGSTINFEVRGETNAYIDMKSTQLRATIKSVDSKGAPNAADASVGIVNQILHSMWSQVDLTLQHTTMKSLGHYYAYKAIIDQILNSSIDDNNRKDRLSMYIKDRGENIGSTDTTTLDNISLKIREVSMSTPTNKQ